jgi:hypothetical protein
MHPVDMLRFERNWTLDTNWQLTIEGQGEDIWIEGSRAERLAVFCSCLQLSGVAFAVLMCGGNHMEHCQPFGLRLRPLWRIH